MQQEREVPCIDLSKDPPNEPRPPPPLDPPRPRKSRSRRSSSLSAAQQQRQQQQLLQLRVYEPQFHQQQQQQHNQEQQLETRVTRVVDFDKAYFNCYADIGVHEEMIKDHVRTDAYKTAIMHHHSFIAGKVVLDVGCGTGILSIFCAQAGAKRVYAVEASNIALQAKSVVEANNLSNVVIVLHGRVEDVEINEKVDVIISEWMGYVLLYESMLGSVIYARDRWLKPGGLILPSNATLYMAPVTHPKRYSESVDFWRNVYGIDMSAMMQLAKQSAFEEPSVETISPENVLTWPHVVKHVNCCTVTIPELESITTWFSLRSMKQAPLHGFAFWFDVDFRGPPVAPMPLRTSPSGALVLSTAPEDPPTHWQQTVIYFYDPIEVEQDQLIEGSVTLSQSQENVRFMNIHLQYSLGGRVFVKESVFR